MIVQLNISMVVVAGCSTCDQIADTCVHTLECTCDRRTLSKPRGLCHGPVPGSDAVLQRWKLFTLGALGGGAGTPVHSCAVRPVGLSPWARQVLRGREGRCAQRRERGPAWLQHPLRSPLPGPAKTGLLSLLLPHCHCTQSHPALLILYFLFFQSCSSVSRRRKPGGNGGQRLGGA